MKARTPRPHRPRRSRVARSDRRRVVLRVMARMGLADAKIRTRSMDYDDLVREASGTEDDNQYWHDTYKAAPEDYFGREGTAAHAAAYDDLLERRGGEQRHLVARTPEGVEVLPWRPR